MAASLEIAKGMLLWVPLRTDWWRTTVAVGYCYFATFGCFCLTFAGPEQSRLLDMVYCITVHLYAKDDEECIRKLKNKLIEASRVYSKGE